MDELFDQGIHSSVGNTPDAESASRACGATPIPDSQLTQEEIEAATIEPKFAKKARYWSQRLSKTICDRSMGKEDYLQEIFLRVMAEWKRVRCLRPKFRFFAHNWVKTFACKIIEESKAKKRGNQEKATDIFEGQDGKVLDKPPSSACSDQMMLDVLNKAESKFSGKQRLIISLLRKGFKFREIQGQIEEELNPEINDRTSPRFQKCSLGTITNVRKKFISLAREIHTGIRLS